MLISTIDKFSYFMIKKDSKSYYLRSQESKIGKTCDIKQGTNFMAAFSIPISWGEILQNFNYDYKKSLNIISQLLGENIVRELNTNVRLIDGDSIKEYSSIKNEKFDVLKEEIEKAGGVLELKKFRYEKKWTEEDLFEIQDRFADNLLFFFG